jgi:hypothetical protein
MGGNFNLNILELAGVNEVKGDVGIEIEAEFSRDIEKQYELGYWMVVSDGSLRGSSCEFVLRRPIDISAVPKALTEVYERLSRLGVIDPSDNCSTHVHLNCQQMDIKQVVTFVCCLIILEPLLLKACNPSRKGNLFCVDAANCDGLFTSLEAFAARGRIPNSNSSKYSGINLSSLGTFGSVEMRHMHFPVPEGHLNSWVNVLHNIKINSMEWFDSENPTDLLDKFSSVGINEFISTIAPDLKNMVDCEDHDILQECRLNMRLAQPSLYESLHFNGSVKRKKSSLFDELSVGDHIGDRLSPSDYTSTLNPAFTRTDISPQAQRTLSINLETVNSPYFHSFGAGYRLTYNGMEGGDIQLARPIRDKLISLLPDDISSDHIANLRSRSGVSSFIHRYRRAVASAS